MRSVSQEKLALALSISFWPEHFLRQLLSDLRSRSASSHEAAKVFPLLAAADSLTRRYVPRPTNFRHRAKG